MFEGTRIFPMLKNFESLQNKNSNPHKNLYLHNRTYCLIIIQKCTILKKEGKRRKNISKDAGNVVFDRSPIDVTLSRPLY